LESVVKESGHDLFEYYASICLEDLGKMVKNIGHNNDLQV
jgi:hypothetical protein